MSQVEWQIVKDVFYTALNRPPAERSDFLDSACGGNPLLRSEVEFLLDSYESGFLEEPLLGALAPKTVPNEPLFEPGREFSHYKILKMLGRGGMGEVYLANDLALDRLAAIKVIHGDSGFGDQSAERLIREARSVAKLDHVNICQVYEVAEADGHPFIAMQYVDGDMLDSLIGAGPIAYEDAISYTRQIATALAKAHSWGIVHRDIKPSNIIIDPSGHLKVLDFGLAKETTFNAGAVGLSAVGLIAGTVTYMSPEHARGQPINGQTDIWSLGVVFYQMLTGRLPFRGENRADLIAAILNDEFADPGDLPQAVKYILSRALQKDVADRYATIEEMDADLAELAETGTVSRSAGYTVPGAVIEVPSAGREVSRGRTARLAIAAVLLLVVTGAGSFGFWRYRTASAASRPFASVASLTDTTIFDMKRLVNGAVFDLSFSPDGKRIAYGLSSGTGHVVYVQTLADGEPVPVTPAASINYSPVWSPDGQRLAYLSTADGKTGIWSVPASGGVTVRLAELGEFSSRRWLRKWSNDGTRIFIEESDGLSQIELATGNMTLVDMSGAEGRLISGIAVSPDESRMLVVTDMDGSFKLWVKSIDANDARCICDSFSSDGSLAWLPDNRRFVYASPETGNLQLYVRDIDGSPAQQITFGSSNIEDPAVSPDGSRIVHTTATNEANLFSTDIESMRETVITSKTNMQLLPAFSPDGRQIAYGTAVDVNRYSSGALKIESFDRSESSPPVQFGRPGCCVRWSPNGDEAAYLVQSGSVRNIWKFGFRDKKETQITGGGIGWPGNSIAPISLLGLPFDQSPDGMSFVYSSKRSGQENIWTAAADGSGETKLTDFHDGTTRAVSPAWSPDGSRIAFVEAIGMGSTSGSKDNRIAIYNNGNIIIAGRFNAWTLLLGWSNDGKGVYVSVAGDGYHDIFLVPADGSTPLRKARLQNTVRSGYGIKISPDQQWVVYTQRRDDIDNLYLVPLSGGEARRVTVNSDTTLFYSGVTWSPDSKKLLYSKQTGGQAISLLADTRQEAK